MAERKISALTASVVGDHTDTTSILEASINVTTTPASRKLTFGVLRDWLASAATGLAAVAVTVLNLGVGTAALANRSITVGGTLIASAGLAFGLHFGPVLQAAANGDVFRGLNISPTFTPGAFTGLIYQGINVGSRSVATFTSPADPAMLAIGILTGTGATNAIGVSIGAPTGATNNYLLGDASLNTFTVLATGQVGIGTASLAKNGIRMAAVATAVAGSAVGIANNPNLTATANGDTMAMYSTSAILSPGAFTGVTAYSLNLSAFSVAAFSSPADPAQLNISVLTGTGATNAHAILVAVPTGATNNYIIADSNHNIFTVTAAGAIFTASTATFGAAGNTVLNLGGAAAAATTATKFIKAYSAIANAVATATCTVTIPNAAHSCRVRVTIVAALGTGGSIGADEATGTITYDISVARTAGVNAVATVSTGYGSAVSNVAGGQALTVTAVASAISGAVGATNTFTVNVTITRAGAGATNHTAIVMAEVINANATGVTVS